MTTDKTDFVAVTVGDHRFKVAGHRTPAGKWRVEGVQTMGPLPPGSHQYINDRIIRALEASEELQKYGLMVTPIDLFRAGLVE